ncbi:MAG: formimidoylglutamase [Cyclobacteriaceae bacterium]|nr:formimidoylglutamase [Cyclobacteriaceae bacterium]
MDLKLFFTPVSDELVSCTNDRNSFLNNIAVYHETLPNYKEADIALVGVSEWKEENDTLTQIAPDKVREKLYHLKKGFGTYNIVDLGNLKRGVDVADTNTRLQEVCQNLLENNTLPVIIGGTHDMDYAQYKAYEDMNKLITFLNVDAFLDMENDGELPENQKHIQKVLLHEPNYLFSYSHLAYQSYLINRESIDTLEKLYFDAYRIGSLRDRIPDMEPVIRDADMLSFDITAIRSSDAPGTARAQPFGLTGEEACQICWYAGLNEKLSSIGFYEYAPQLDDDRYKTASVISTMVWYFIEGFYHRKQEQNFKSNDYMKYVVSLNGDPDILLFYKSKLSEKWWMEIPHPSENEKYIRNSIVPCSYTDYETATKGELPERYITTLNKLL